MPLLLIAAREYGSTAYTLPQIRDPMRGYVFICFYHAGINGNADPCICILLVCDPCISIRF